MDNNTIQQKLKEIYYSLGGNADEVRDINDSGVILDKIAALNLGSKMPGGEGEYIIDTISLDFDSELGLWTTRKSYDEMLSGLAEGRLPALVNMAGELIPLERTTSNSIIFSHIVHDDETDKEDLQRFMVTQNNDVWDASLSLASASGAEPYIIELTPTEPDMSGEMDVSPNTIYNKLIAGRNMVFSIPSLAAFAVCTSYMIVGEGIAVAQATFEYEVSGVPGILKIITTNNEEESRYYTEFYPLTTT